MFNDFLTLEALQVWIVAVSITVLITQFTKELVDWTFSLMHLKPPTKYVVYIWALVVLFLPQIGVLEFTFQIIATNLLNAIIVTMAAMKSYETILEKAINKVDQLKQEIRPEITN